MASTIKKNFGPRIKLRKSKRLKCILGGKEIEINLSANAEKELEQLKQKIDPNGILKGVK